MNNWEITTEQIEENKALLQDIYSFADLLLGEILEKRCDSEKEFYLPGLPLTDRELLPALKEIYSQEEASIKVLQAWKKLKETLMDSFVTREMPPFIQLCWLYEMDELWVLTTILAFVFGSDPKYEKAFKLLQGDSGRRGMDVFLAGAIAFYLGAEGETTTLSVESRIKTDLFEESENGELCMRRHVQLWLNLQEDMKLTLRSIFTLHFFHEDTPNLHREKLEWANAVVKNHLQEDSGNKLLIEIQGRKGAGKKHFCSLVAKNIGYTLGIINMSILLERLLKERKDLMNAIFFACRVNSCIPYLELTGCQEDSEAISLARTFAQEYKLMFMGTEPASAIAEKLDTEYQSISLEKISMEDSLNFWKWMGSKYSVDENVDYEQLAGKYRLLPAAINEIFVKADRKCRINGQENIKFDLLLSSIREYNQFSGNALMERIDTVFNWNDLRVEPQVIDGMKLACAHLKYKYAIQKNIGDKFPYGSGVGVLFYGPPGTGKTMAAQVIANELQMDLCRVDLSQVTSKYVGETEKNLEKIFRDAEQSNVILFFDEADAMFGKRSEVKDANDKYANQETSYILQRIESYNGMVILATNFAQNFDPAFMRRISISIHFSLPDENIRKELWTDMLKTTPLAEDKETIRQLAAQFELSGSNIKNIIRNAMFLALMENRPLSIADIAKAIKIEFEKTNKIANTSAFGMFISYI